MSQEDSSASLSPEDKIERLRFARASLLGIAKGYYHRGLSVNTWLEDLGDQPAKLGLSPQEVEAIWRLTWGIGGRRFDI